MNYYEHHIGDYAEATAHLSFIEDAAYSRLIRKYYASEKPLPAELKAVQRLVGARTKEEKEAVETILDEFFFLDADGWHNTRCDEETARFKDKQAKAKRSAEARWNKHQTHSDGNANASPDAMRTHSEGSAPRARSKHQAPSTKHQTPDVNPNPIAAASELQTESPEKNPSAAADAITGRAIELVAMLRKRGAAIQASDPRVRSWAERGISDAQALQSLEVANERRAQQANPAPVNAGLLDAILGDIASAPSRNSPANSREQQRDETIEVLTGRSRTNERTNAKERDITGECHRVA